MQIPKVVKIRQTAVNPVLTDVEGQIRRGMAALKVADRVRPGQTVAIGCTSRGIPDYPRVVRTVVAALKELGLRPFLIPAMGSHGASTAQGQADFLRNYGLTEEAVGAPIRSQIDVVEIGRSRDLDLAVYVDALAMEADHIVVLNRIKTHTDFINRFESGIIKILTIGLGKFIGAKYYHKAIMRYGFPRVLSDVTSRILETGKVLFGVGVVENSRGQIADLGVLDTRNFPALLEGEAKLLEEYNAITLHLPFDRADVLVIDKVGKDVSGTGLDTKVVGRIYKPLISPEPESPRIKRIIALGLTEHSSGSPGSPGMLDFISKNYERQTNWESVTVNGLAASMPEFCRKPPVMPTDRDTVLAACDSVGLYEPEEIRLMRILTTGSLEELYVSTAYLEELRGRPDLQILSDPQPIPFDEEGNILPFAQSDLNQ